MEIVMKMKCMITLSAVFLIIALFAGGAAAENGCMGHAAGNAEEGLCYAAAENSSRISEDEQLEVCSDRLKMLTYACNLVLIGGGDFRQYAGCLSVVLANHYLSGCGALVYERAEETYYRRGDCFDVCNKADLLYLVSCIAASDSEEAFSKCYATWFVFLDVCTEFCDEPFRAY